MKTNLPPSTARLIVRRNASLKKLARLGPVLRGSLVSAQRGNHLARQLTLSVRGKTHTVYVPPGMVKEVKEWIGNYRKLKAIIQETSTLNLAIIHRYGPESRAGSKK